MEQPPDKPAEQEVSAVEGGRADEHTESDSRGFAFWTGAFCPEESERRRETTQVGSAGQRDGYPTQPTLHRIVPCACRQFGFRLSV